MSNAPIVLKLQDFVNQVTSGIHVAEACLHCKVCNAVKILDLPSLQMNEEYFYDAISTKSEGQYSINTNNDGESGRLSVQLEGLEMQLTLPSFK